MFLSSSAPILFSLLTVIGTGALAALLPMIAQKTGAKKYFSQTSIDIVVGLLAAYALIGLIMLIAALMSWLSSLGPFGHEYRW